jgi:hypothetical protein
MDWNPIDTAPQHGVILLTDGHGLWPGFRLESVWLFGFRDGDTTIRVRLHPTHWAPMPALPGAEAEAPAPADQAPRP